MRRTIKNPTGVMIITGKNVKKEIEEANIVRASEESPSPRFVSYDFKSKVGKILKAMRPDVSKAYPEDLNTALQRVDESIML